MPTWSGILAELKASVSKSQTGHPDFDGIRRKYIIKAHEHTKRDTILYASAWTQVKGNLPPGSIDILDEDLQGIMEVIHGLKGPNLDLILHSPGGSPEATEAIVSYLRSKFDHIRIIIPYAAMSAATMLSCSADVIVMGKHSFIGPIDPQLIIQTPLGPRMAPAQAILEQFEQAKEDCKDPQKIAAWLPMLGQYGPDLLVQCKHISEMSAQLVKQWLSNYMFKNSPDKDQKAADIAKWLSKHKDFKSHGRHIPRSEAANRGLIIENLEDNQNSQDLFLSVFHAATHTFSGTAAVKIIENHLGKAFIKLGQMPIQIQIPPPILPPTTPTFSK